VGQEEKNTVLICMSRSAHIIVEHPDWLARMGHLRRLIRKSCWAACAHEQLQDKVSLTVVCSGDTVLYSLNSQYRGKHAPTNVLSFPSGEEDEAGERYLGDIVISMDTLAREAAEQKKSLEDHFCHLIVHSVLHLLGYDHEGGGEADIMEAKEVKILEKLGIRNPYI
jgi:probable rRNA maturation factor